MVRQRFEEKRARRVLTERAAAGIEVEVHEPQNETLPKRRWADRRAVRAIAYSRLVKARFLSLEGSRYTAKNLSR
jgi:hypothetical protein